MKREEIIKRIRKLEEIYNYWFEVFRRSTDKIQKEKAKKIYHEAIEENIRLQNEYNLSVPPRYSSSERAEMEIDARTETLFPSDKQLKQQRILDDFEKDKKILEEHIIEKLIKDKADYVKGVLDRMISVGLKSESDKIAYELNKLEFYKLDSDLPIEAKFQLLLPLFVINFIKFFSGEMFIQYLYETYNDALENYQKCQFEKAEELYELCLSMLVKAAQNSILDSGKTHFQLRAENLMSEWASATNAIRNRAEHDRRQLEIKNRAVELITRNPGILQTEVYRLLGSYAKAEISEALYYLAKENRISREKKASTYKLFKD